MNKATKPSEMDVHYKNGVLTCKYCKVQQRTKWPITAADVIAGHIETVIAEFKAAHDQCAMNHFGLNTN